MYKTWVEIKNTNMHFSFIIQDIKSRFSIINYKNANDMQCGTEQFNVASRLVKKIKFLDWSHFFEMVKFAFINISLIKRILSFQQSGTNQEAEL